MTYVRKCSHCLHFGSGALIVLTCEIFLKPVGLTKIYIYTIKSNLLGKS